MTFAVTSEILEVDHAAHRLRWVARLPFGIANDQITSLAPLGPAQCRISFG